MSYELWRPVLISALVGFGGRLAQVVWQGASKKIAKWQGFAFHSGEQGHPPKQGV